MKVAFVWQRFLPYHVARLRAAKRALEAAGAGFVALEVAAQDATYGFPAVDRAGIEPVVRVLAEGSYHEHRAAEVHARVLACLERERPDVVFCPATAFPEGMAGIGYRCRAGEGARVVVMDAAWERTDMRGPLTRVVKRVVHRNVDAALVPAPSHAAYYRGLGFPDERLFFGVDAVDDEAYAAAAARTRAREAEERARLGLPPAYFLSVGRLLPRKGLDTLLDAYARYRSGPAAGNWELVIVGTGPEEARVRGRAAGLPGVRLAGNRFGDELAAHYALAGALVVPSERDPWALVVNEGAACSLPLIVSRGCGAAATLVREGENGWSFEPGDAARLSSLLGACSRLPAAGRLALGGRSREIVAAWSLDRFAAGVLGALGVPRRPRAGVLSDLLVRLWKGRVGVQ